MANIEVSIVIDRPLDEVFAYMSDEENNVNWRSSGMVDVRRTSGVRWGRHDVRIVNHIMGRRIEGEAEVTQYELNRKYATTNKSGPRIETQRTFEAVDGGTRVTFAVDADLAGLFQLAEPLITSVVGDDLKTMSRTSRTSWNTRPNREGQQRRRVARHPRGGSQLISTQVTIVIGPDRSKSCSPI